MGALPAGRPRDLAGKRAHPLTPGDSCTRNLQAQPQDGLSGPPSTPLTWGSEPGLPPRLPPPVSDTPCKRLCELALGELEEEGRPAPDTHSPLCLKSQQARPRWPPQAGGASLRLPAASPAGSLAALIAHCPTASSSGSEQAANTAAHGQPHSSVGPPISGPPGTPTQASSMTLTGSVSGRPFPAQSLGATPISRWGEGRWGRKGTGVENIFFHRSSLTWH